MTTLYLVTKEKNKIYKSEDMVLAIYGKNLLHNEKGAPILEEGHISISDTKKYWACAYSCDPLGIDLEEFNRTVTANALKKLHKSEAEYMEGLSFGTNEWREEFLSIWTKKESYSKFAGKGLGIGFSRFSVLPEYEYKLECKLYNYKFKDLIIGSTEELEIEPYEYKAPMNKSALEAGADILDMFGCSAKKLTEKLIDRGYSEEETKAAVEKLLDIGFLNDTELAKSYARKFEARGYGSRRIEFELKQKGIGAETAKEVAAIYKEGDRKRALAQGKKLAKTGEMDDKTKAKIARKLASLGYDTSLVYDILSKLGKNV